MIEQMFHGPPSMSEIDRILGEMFPRCRDRRITCIN